MNGPIRLVSQRTKRDCSVACLSSVTGRSYEQTLMAFRHPVYDQGATMRQIRDAAGRLGFVASLHRQVDLESGFGILALRMPSVNETNVLRDHVVVLLDGYVIDLEEPMSMWDVDDYMKAFNAKILSIITVRPRTREDDDEQAGRPRGKRTKSGKHPAHRRSRA